MSRDSTGYHKHTAKFRENRFTPHLSKISHTSSFLSIHSFHRPEAGDSVESTRLSALRLCTVNHLCTSINSLWHTFYGFCQTRISRYNFKKFSWWKHFLVVVPKSNKISFFLSATIVCLMWDSLKYLNSEYFLKGYGLKTCYSDGNWDNVHTLGTAMRLAGTDSNVAAASYCCHRSKPFSSRKPGKEITGLAGDVTRRTHGRKSMGPETVAVASLAHLLSGNPWGRQSLLKYILVAQAFWKSSTTYSFIFPL